MANANSAKGNPASKRMSNPNLKARRARSWKRGKERKEARRQEAAIAFRRNSRDRRDHIPTPWEQAKIARKARRILARLEA